MPARVSRTKLRLSDAERESVAEFLRAQALEGRLDHDELEERLGLAYRAITVGDVEALVADLPRAPVERVTRGAPPARRRSAALLLLGLAALLAIWVPSVLGIGLMLMVALGIAMLAMVFVVGFAFGPLILLALVILHAVRRRRPRSWRWDTPRLR